MRRSLFYGGWKILECFEKNQNLRADAKYLPKETLMQRCVYEGG